MKPTKEMFIKRAEMLNLLANPTRLCIMYGLFINGIRCVGEIQTCSNVPQSSVSQHLAKLKAAGIVKCERKANEMHYEIANDEVVEIIKLLFPAGKED